MKVSFRSILSAGMAAVTATAVVAAPAINPAPAAAAVQPVAVSIPVQNTAASTTLKPLTSLIEAFGAPPNALASLPGALTPTLMPMPTPTAATVAPLMGNYPSTGLIMNAYNAIEPWVAWGVDLAAWGIGWVPWIGLLAIPIRVVYYTGEPIVQSLFQVAQDVVKLNFSNIPSALVDGVVTAVGNFIYQIAPPLPPLPFAARQSAPAPTSTAAHSDLGAKVTEGIRDLVDRTAPKELTPDRPLPLTGSETAAKGGVEPTVDIPKTEIQDPAVQGVKVENGESSSSVPGATPLGSLRNKLPALTPTATRIGAWKKAGATKEKSAAVPNAGADPADATPDKQSPEARNNTETHSDQDADQSGPQHPKPSIGARKGGDTDNAAAPAKQVRSHTRGH